MNSSAAIAFDPDGLLARRFPVATRGWDAQKAVRWARDFGAGLPGELSAHDARFLDERQNLALPMIAAPLCDGEFWERRPDAGIDWRQIVHAEEVLTLHHPLPMAGHAVLSQSIVAIGDRGAGKGASMVQRFSLLAQLGGLAYADLDVTTVLRGNGGFGGPVSNPVRRVPLPERRPDACVEIQTPGAADTSLGLPSELTLGGGVAIRPGQRMLRGTACFGIAGRAALALLCGNDPARLKRVSVRFAGPALSGETLGCEIWNMGPGEAVLRMRAVEREVPIVSHGTVTFLS